MARAHRVASSRTIHRCHKGHDILPPEGYTWAAPGFRARKKFACAQHPFKPSELTVGLVSEALSAAEDFEAALDQISDDDTDALDQITSAVEEFSSAISDYVAQREEAFNAWENGNSQLEDLYETAQAALNEIEGFQVQDWDGDEEARDRGFESTDDEVNPDDLEAADAYRSHVQDQIEEARNLASLEF